MLLRNYYNQLHSFFSEQTITNGLKLPDGTLANCCCPSSTQSFTIARTFTSASATARTGYSSYGFIVGSGRTPASVEDYCLESLITSSLYLSVVQSTDGDGNYIWVGTLTNKASEPITVGEIGILMSCYNKSSSSCTCLVERTVLDEPLTLGAGESGFISYKVRFAPTVGSFPTA